MEIFRASLGLLVLAIGAATGIVLARRRRFSTKRVVLDVLGIALGCIVGIAPGAFLVVGRSVIGATGTRDGTGPFSWPDWLLLTVVLGGLGAGALVGLAAAEKLNGQRSRLVAFATSAGGLTASCLVAAAGIALAQNSQLELAALVLIPLTVIGMTLAGYVLPASTPR